MVSCPPSECSARAHSCRGLSRGALREVKVEVNVSETPPSPSPTPPTPNSACFMNWMDGCACAPDTSRGKGNHCKSHSVPCASFGQNVEKKRLVYPPRHFLFISALSSPGLSTHQASIGRGSPEVFFFILPICGHSFKASLQPHPKLTGF